MSNLINIIRKQNKKSNSIVDNKIFQFRNNDISIGLAYYSKLFLALANTRNPDELIKRRRRSEKRLKKSMC